MNILKQQDSISIQKFFNDFELQISAYQRPYVWTGKQIINLYNDLKAFNNSNDNRPDYYLGNIILVKKENKLQIIDGQQRIISLLIISRILKQPLYNNQFDIRSEESIKNITTNSGYLKDYCAKYPLEKKLEWEKIHITYIIANNDDQAFKFYTTLSTSGKRLTGLDIIKPYHLQALPKNKQESKAVALEKYQFNNNELEKTIQLLLRSRYWKGIDFKEFPYVNDTLNWKEKLENEFVTKSLNNLEDKKYGNIYLTSDIEHYSIPNYRTDQPLNKGENTINYLLYFSELWNQIIERFENPNLKEIISLDRLSGAIYNNEYFQIALLTYVSKFQDSLNNIEHFEKVVKLLFKICYYTRLDKTVRKTSVYKFEEKIKLINRILLAYEEKEILLFCKSFYNEEYLSKYNKHINETFKSKSIIQKFNDKFNIDTSNLINPFFN